MKRHAPPRALLLDFGGTLDSEGVPWKERFRALLAAELGADDPRVAPAVFDRAFYDADDVLVGAVARNATLDEIVGRLTRDLLARLVGGDASPGAVQREISSSGREQAGAARLVRSEVASGGVRREIPSNEGIDALATRIGAAFLRASRQTLSRNLSLLSSLSSSSSCSIRIGFVSNFYGNLPAVLEREGFGAWARAAADSARVGVTKPDPALFRHALALLGVDPEDALMVGDSWPRDVLGARAAGLRAAWLAPAEPRDEVEGVPVLRSLADVARLLAGAGRLAGAGVIAAGDGTRLREPGLPAHKPLVPVAGLPLVAHVLDGFRAAGLAPLAVIFNDRERDCASFVENRYRDLVPQVLVKTTASSLESFGEVLRLLPAGRVLVSTVDAFLPPADLRRFVREAEGAPEDAMVLAVTPFVDDEKPLRARVGADGRVLALGADGDVVTAGLYVVPEALRRRAWPAGLARLRDLLAWAVTSGLDVRAVSIPKVVDVDRPSDLAEAEKLFSEADAW